MLNQWLNTQWCDRRPNLQPPPQQQNNNSHQNSKGTDEYQESINKNPTHVNVHRLPACRAVANTKWASCSFSFFPSALKKKKKKRKNSMDAVCWLCVSVCATRLSVGLPLFPQNDIWMYNQSVCRIYIFFSLLPRETRSKPMAWWLVYTVCLYYVCVHSIIWLYFVSNTKPNSIRIQLPYRTSTHESFCATIPLFCMCIYKYTFTELYIYTVFFSLFLFI